MEIWGGIECTINRVGDTYHDQLDFQGHYSRVDDIKRIADLGIKKIRYPILWEKHKPSIGAADWSAIDGHLTELNANGISVIAGLVHHGSGPIHVSIMDDSFALGLASYAREVAARYPWINDFTPVNEPLTTARFTGLYGLWYPHLKHEDAFLRILVNECKATVLAMQEIRKLRPEARLIHTEDLGKTHSTEELRYQADFENMRRWLGMDLLCGKVNEHHFFWRYMLDRGIEEAELRFFQANITAPDVMGFNYYVTSERYLDEATANYPQHTHGGNGQHHYADVEAVRSGDVSSKGLKGLLIEAWQRYHIPLAITEAHLHCGREDQLRWLKYIVETSDHLKDDEIPVIAVTAWSLFGAYGWKHLLTHQDGSYESGVFDLRSSLPRPTALATMIKSLTNNTTKIPPVSYGAGWWERSGRIIYGSHDHIGLRKKLLTHCDPVIVIGAESGVGRAIVSACQHRNITFMAFNSWELDPGNRPEIELKIDLHKPWAIIEAEHDDFSASKVISSATLAEVCQLKGIKLLTFSSDQVFDGRKQGAYTESDGVNPINSYGIFKARGEEKILNNNPDALIIRSGSLFGNPEADGMIQKIIRKLCLGQHVNVPDDVFISPTHILDLVNSSLDLLIDDECSIWHLANHGRISCSELATEIANRNGFNSKLIVLQPLSNISLGTEEPVFNSLTSDKGIFLPSLDHALTRAFGNSRRHTA